jgi:hypothetical protein
MEVQVTVGVTLVAGEMGEMGEMIKIKTILYSETSQKGFRIEDYGRVTLRSEQIRNIWLVLRKLISAT